MLIEVDMHANGHSVAVAEYLQRACGGDGGSKSDASSSSPQPQPQLQLQAALGCRMANLSQAWILPRAKWEHLPVPSSEAPLWALSDKDGVTLFSSGSVQGWVAVDDLWAPSVPEQGAQAQSQGSSVQVGAVCLCTGEVGAWTRSYCPNGQLVSVVWQQGSVL